MLFFSDRHTNIWGQCPIHNGTADIFVGVIDRKIHIHHSYNWEFSEPGAMSSVTCKVMQHT